MINGTTVNTDDEISKRDSTKRGENKKYGPVPTTYPGPPAYKLAGPECR